jgi:hypothetical protein
MTHTLVLAIKYRYGEYFAAALSKRAYALADAMIEERSKQQNPAESTKED